MKLHWQRGATLIEVLVSMLLLSAGVVALSSLAAHAVQMPKLSDARAMASTLASAHIEKIRANPAAFISGDYTVAALSFDGTFNAITVDSCTFPDCTPEGLAAMDTTATSAAARRSLPAGGMLTQCEDDPCTPQSYGNVWVVWIEPKSVGALDGTGSENCPAKVRTDHSGDKRVRCVYMRFRL